MIPIRDENPTRRFPFVTVAFIAANVVVFVYQMTLPPAALQKFVYTFGAIPILLTRDLLQLPQVPAHWTGLFSSMFVHGGIMHLAGNMLYLWIFGNNVEDYLGRLKFILFYVVCGLAAALAHTFSDVTSAIPMIGASGAISGVLGAYLILYPRARVVVLIWFFFFIRFVRVPAFLVLGLWFVMQIPGALGDESGIAWFAHIGGFVFGFLVIRLLGRGRPRQPRYV
ncbi:rhomboid family intramembrane serine protease [bacterium]|nr:rhomboid family intramembrane serine protease [bacterium]MBU1983684.1 rhomboid family intramembrane serine protease [bacterium]